MKKNYFLLTALSVMMAFGTATAQTDAQLSTYNPSADEISDILNDVQDYHGETGLSLKASCDSLSTPLVGGNAFKGNMFDVNVLNTITVETFSMVVDAGNFNVAIFYKTGTFVGSTNTAGDWTFLDSATVTGMGTGIAVKVPVDVNLPLAVGTYAFYVTVTDAAGGNEYTDGTAVGDLVIADANIEILEGDGGDYPFAVNNSPRVFNGEMFYCTGAVGIEEGLQLDALIMFPNPANNSVSLDLNLYNGEQVSLSIVNAIGQTVITSQFVANGVATYDISDLSKGVYFTQLQIGSSVSTTKLVIE